MEYGMKCASGRVAECQGYKQNSIIIVIVVFSIISPMLRRFSRINSVPHYRVENTGVAQYAIKSTDDDGATATPTQNTNT